MAARASFYCTLLLSSLTMLEPAGTLTSKLVPPNTGVFFGEEILVVTAASVGLWISRNGLRVSAMPSKEEFI